MAQYHVPKAVTSAVPVRVTQPGTAFGPFLLKARGQSMSALPFISDVNLFRNLKGIINLDAEISDGTLDLGVSQQQLNCTQISGALVNHCRLGSPQ